jgi:hypothetical protein
VFEWHCERRSNVSCSTRSIVFCAAFEWWPAMDSSSSNLLMTKEERDQGRINSYVMSATKIPSSWATCSCRSIWFLPCSNGGQDDPHVGSPLSRHTKRRETAEFLVPAYKKQEEMIDSYLSIRHHSPFGKSFIRCSTHHHGRALRNPLHFKSR